MCHYTVEKYYRGLEDGFIVKDNLKMKSPPHCNPLLMPFIYDENGKKQIIYDDDYIIIKDNQKTLQNNIVIKFTKYL